MPQGVVGLLLAGLLAAFMSNFAATINAAPAYIVNDIYKRFINPNTTPNDRSGDEPLALARRVGRRHCFRSFDDRTSSTSMMWIVGALYGGYVMANVLKWYWWRFNGYGYFWGMMAGILGAMIVPETGARIAPDLFAEVAAIIQSNPLYVIPVLLVLSLVGCLLGTLSERAGRRRHPQALLQNDPALGILGTDSRPGRRRRSVVPAQSNALRDCTNVAVGIVWQLCLTSLPIFLVLRSWNWAGARLSAARRDEHFH